MDSKQLFTPIDMDQMERGREEEDKIESPKTEKKSPKKTFLKRMTEKIPERMVEKAIEKARETRKTLHNASRSRARAKAVAEKRQKKENLFGYLQEKEEEEMIFDQGKMISYALRKFIQFARETYAIHIEKPNIVIRNIKSVFQQQGEIVALQESIRNYLSERREFELNLEKITRFIDENPDLQKGLIRASNAYQKTMPQRSVVVGEERNIFNVDQREEADNLKEVADFRRLYPLWMENFIVELLCGDLISKEGIDYTLTGHDEESKKEKYTDPFTGEEKERIVREGIRSKIRGCIMAPEGYTDTTRKGKGRKSKGVRKSSGRKTQRRNAKK